MPLMNKKQVFWFNYHLVIAACHTGGDYPHIMKCLDLMEELATTEKMTAAHETAIDLVAAKFPYQFPNFYMEGSRDDVAHN